MGIQWYDDKKKPTTLYEDNQSCIAMIRNEGQHSKRTKHIDIRYFYTREQENFGNIKLKYCPTELMLADIYTKPLVNPQFELLAKQVLGILPITLPSDQYLN